MSWRSFAGAVAPDLKSNRTSKFTEVVINAFVLDLLHVEVSRPSRLQLTLGFFYMKLYFRNINTYKLPMALTFMARVIATGHWQEVQSRNQVTWQRRVTSRAPSKRFICWCQGLAQSILLQRAAQRAPKRCGCLGTDGDWFHRMLPPNFPECWSFFVLLLDVILVINLEIVEQQVRSIHK